MANNGLDAWQSVLRRTIFEHVLYAAGPSEKPVWKGQDEKGGNLWEEKRTLEISLQGNEELIIS